MGDPIGPILPPHLRKNMLDNAAIGPVLPPHLRDDKGDNSENDLIGPSLPQTTRQNLCHREDIPVPIGSCVPPCLVESSDIESYGPSLPPNFNPKSQPTPLTEDEDDPIIGPLPPANADMPSSSVAEEFEKRSKKMKDRLTGNEELKKLEREEWMTELPPILQGLGNGPRKFRAHERVIGDRSVWTDTPADKARKARSLVKDPIKDEDRITMQSVHRRDKEISDMLAKDRHSNAESLMSMHEKERKRKADEAEASGEAKLRRPFDRDIDLQANKFDEAARKRVMKQSQGLSSRFSSASTTSKFL